MKFRDLSEGHRKRLVVLLAVYLTIGIGIIIYGAVTLNTERRGFIDKWSSYYEDAPEQAAIAAELSKDAVTVTVGTYVENLREIDLKTSSYRIEMLAWFKWKGEPDLDPAHHFRVYRGIINKLTVVKETTAEDGEHYQLVRLDTTVSKNFNTRRFPLESYGLRTYFESEYPIQEVVFAADRENSGLNRSISISGYEFGRFEIGAVSYKYDSTHGDPDLQGFEMSSEIVTGVEINRSSLGLYLKCFIALIGTVSWCFIALYLNSFHHVDPLGMIPGALFGTVSNIMVGASLLPDALEMGLLEYVNGWGILTIMAVSVAIININRVRTKYEDSDAAHYIGAVLFRVLIALCVAGNVLFPLSAYIWNI